MTTVSGTPEEISTPKPEHIVDLDDKFLSIKQVADIFSVRPYAVREWLKTGKMKGVKIEGQWRIQKSVIQAYAQKKYGESNP